MKSPNFDDMTNIMNEWCGEESYVQELINDHTMPMTKDEIVEKTAIDMIHGYMSTAAMNAIEELIKVGADNEWIKSLLDDAIHNLESDLRIELGESFG